MGRVEKAARIPLRHSALACAGRLFRPRLAVVCDEHPDARQDRSLGERRGSNGGTRPSIEPRLPHRESRAAAGPGSHGTKKGPETICDLGTGVPTEV
jgi:hypothetical protein